MVDSLFHDRWASEIADGNIRGQEAFFRAPLYIYILGLIYALFGHSLLAARIFGMICGLTTAYVVYRLAVRIFNRRVATTAALIFILYPIAIYFETELLVDTLFTLLACWSLLLMLQADARGSQWLYAGAGLVLGLAAVTRPIILVFPLLYVIFILTGRESLKKRILRIIWMVVAVMITIAPVAIRNYAVSGDTVLIASSGGVNFFIGNNPDADGLSAAMPPPLGASWQLQDIKYLAEEDTGRELKASELSDYWFRQGLDWVLKNVGDFVGLYIKKLYFSINNFEVSNNRSLDLFFKEFRILQIIPLNFALIAALAGIGVVFLIRGANIDRTVLLLTWFIIIYILVISMFFINARFRLPIIPLLTILAASGLYNMARSLTKRTELKQIIWPIILGVFILVLSYSNLYAVKQNDLSSGYFNRANYYLYLGQYEKAEQLYYQVLTEDIKYPDANLNLGGLFLKQGRGDSARIYFKRELDFYPANARAWSNRASLYYLEQKNDSATIFADRAIALRPYLVDPYLILLRIYFAAGNQEALLSTVARAEESLGQKARLYLEVGIMMTEMGQPDRAETYLLRVLNSRPAAAETRDRSFAYSLAPAHELTVARAAYQLGYIYGLKGDYRSSIEMSSMAVQTDSTLVEAYINLANGLLAVGRNDEAEKIINLGLNKFPGNTILRQLKQIK
jgi:4-amino-4-deoxy-L-arabinose transferase-like glycosyltransferase